MLLLDREFFKPTKKLRSLAIMEALAGNSRLSQHELGEMSAMSGAMVNQYLKDLQDSELIRFVPVNGKSYSYKLTDPGESVQRESFGKYCAEIVQIYSALKNMVLFKLSSLEEKGLTRIALFGASETCEVVLSALQGSNFRILALVDNDPDKHGLMFHGFHISPPAVLKSLDCQAVIITSFGRQDEIYDQIKNNYLRNGLEIVRL